MVMVSTHKKRCVIIGAGVAGIAAAMEAAQQGIEVIVLEAHRYIGGRARSFLDEVTGDTLDNGQHVAMGCYSSLRSMLRQLGTESLLQPDEPIPIVFRSSKESDVFNPYRLPGIAGVLGGIMGMKSFSWRERLRLLYGGIRIGIRRGTRGHTVSSVLQAYKQPRKVVQRFWEPLALATLNAPPPTADASLLTAVVRKAFFGGGTSHHLLVPRAGLSQLWEPFPEWLKQHGGELRLGVRVEELVWLDDRVIGVATSDGEEIRASAVITAVPPKAFVRLLPPTYRERFASVESFETMPIVSVYLWYDTPMHLPPVVGLWGTQSQWVFNRDRIVERLQESRARYPGHVEVTISGARALAQQPAEAIATLVAEELRSIFPEVAEATLLRWRVIKERSATVLLTPKSVYYRLGPQSGIAGLLIAGDWTATGLPATLEGAAQSGRSAARLVAHL